MHANQFRRLALAQGLLPAQRERAPEPDDLPGARVADSPASRGAESLTPPARPATEALH